MPTDRTSHLIAPVPGENRRPRSFYRSFIHFLCSNLGLVFLVGGYSVGGAFLFILLEQYIELQNCQQGSCKYLFFISILSNFVFCFSII
jgi:hypothetical protein